MRLQEAFHAQFFGSASWESSCRLRFCPGGAHGTFMRPLNGAPGRPTSPVLGIFRALAVFVISESSPDGIFCISHSVGIIYIGLRTQEGF